MSTFPEPATSYRRAMAHWPTGVAVVTSVDADGRPCGATVSAVLSVSLDPPTVLVSLAASSATLTAIRQHGALAVHALSATGSALADRFAGPSADRFAGVGWSRSGAVGVPLLADGYTARFEAAVEDFVTFHDHVLVVARVLDATIGAEDAGLVRMCHGYRRTEPSRPPRSVTTAVGPARCR